MVSRKYRLEGMMTCLQDIHVKNATSVNTFESLYLKWKRLNDHWIISVITTSGRHDNIDKTYHGNCTFCIMNVIETDLFFVILSEIHRLRETH